jgi:hypothetical protein
MTKLKTLGLLFLIFLFASSCCETVTIEYDEEETVMEQQAYTEDIEVTEKLTYERIGNTISWKRVGGALLFNRLPKVSATLIIKNTSQKDGEFTLNAIITSDDGTVSAFGQSNIAAGQTGELTAYAEVGHDSYQSGLDISSFEVIAPEVTYIKTETKYRDVPVTKTVTKQRDCKTCEEDCEKFKVIK